MRNRQRSLSQPLRWAVGPLFSAVTRGRLDLRQVVITETQAAFFVGGSANSSGRERVPIASSFGRHLGPSLSFIPINSPGTCYRSAVSPTPDAGEPVIEGNSDHEPGNGNPRPLERETIRDLIARAPCGRGARYRSLLSDARHPANQSLPFRPANS